MEIKETSKVVLQVDGRIIDEHFHDANDAWEKAVNRLMQGALKATITETVSLERK